MNIFVHAGESLCLNMSLIQVSSNVPVASRSCIPVPIWSHAPRLLGSSSAPLLAGGSGSHGFLPDRSRGQSRNQRRSKHSLIHSQENRRKQEETGTHDTHVPACCRRNIPSIKTTISWHSLDRPRWFRFDIRRRGGMQLICFGLHKPSAPTLC